MEAANTIKQNSKSKEGGKQCRLREKLGVSSCNDFFCFLSSEKESSNDGGIMRKTTYRHATNPHRAIYFSEVHGVSLVPFLGVSLVGANCKSKPANIFLKARLQMLLLASYYY